MGNFDKFANREPKGAKKKELIRQAKKKEKKEKAAFFEEKRRQQYMERAAARENSADAGEQPYRKTVAKSENKPPASGTFKRKPATDKRNTQHGSQHARPHPKPGHKHAATLHDAPHKPEHPKPSTLAHPKHEAPDEESRKHQPRKRITIEKKKPTLHDPRHKLEHTNKTRLAHLKPLEEEHQGPLNKYIAHSGLCSRRDAATLVKEGKVQVNGKVVKEPGYKVLPEDLVTVAGKKATPQESPVYILMNKPKDYITTAEDDKGRKTVLDLVKRQVKERIFPVGRLDRNTTGVLLLTNDGDLAQHLTHPSFEVRKVYEVRLDKPLGKSDMEKLAKGITLDDGFIAADEVAYADPNDKTLVGIEIHSGRNRIVRRMFEHLGYNVKGLDRVVFANLTKKNVDRGKWRFLNEKEVRLLKYFNKSKK
jgi:23S rRNA pseudouridine2605 synthase